MHAVTTKLMLIVVVPKSKSIIVILHTSVMVTILFGSLPMTLSHRVSVTVSVTAVPSIK